MSDPPAFPGAPSGAHASKGERSCRFIAACRFLRLSGHLEHGRTRDFLPGQRRGESPIDYLVRIGLARDPHLAAEALIVAAGESEAWQQVLSLLAESAPEGAQPLAEDSAAGK